MLHARTLEMVDKRKSSGHLLVDLPRFALALILLVVPVRGTVDEKTREVLVALYTETHGAEWNGQYSMTHAGNTNWLTGDPCTNQWAGLKCVAGSVQGL